MNLEIFLLLSCTQANGGSRDDWGWMDGMGVADG